MHMMKRLILCVGQTGKILICYTQPGMIALLKFGTEGLLGPIQSQLGYSLAIKKAYPMSPVKRMEYT